MILDNNLVKKIPSEILQLNLLNELSILDNPIELPPPEIALKKNSKNAVFTFFETLEQESLEREKLIEDWEKAVVNTKYEAKFTRIFKTTIDTQRKLKDVLEEISKISELDKVKLEADLMDLLASSKELTKKHKLFEAKLIVLGEERAGKSSLTKAITQQDYKLDPNELSTQGIDITHWTVSKEKLKNSNDFTLNIWDFGGQEIYHATHQFFLTKRSIYLLVTEARKDIRHEDFYYWLNIIKHLGGNSPIIIVTNKIDQPNTGIRIDEFKTLFPNLVDEFKVSCLDSYRASIDNLVNGVITVIKNPKLLPHIGTELPKVYLDIKNEIKRLKEAGKLHLTYSAYIDVCKTFGLNKSQSEEICAFFHDLGVFLHFESDDQVLRETIFLNFEWITKAVYNVLDNQKIIDNNRYFTYKDLTEIWSEPIFVDKQNELLSIMKNKKFDLCFEVDKKKYLAP